MIEPEEVRSKGGISMPHSAHCLANGDVMISSVGDKDGNPKGKTKCSLGNAIIIIIVNAGDC